MRLRFEEFELPSGDLDDPGDLFANDRLGRKDAVVAVCAVVCQIEGPAVVAIEGGWGTGKTAFLKMCAGYLASEESGVPVTVFNAWTQGHTGIPAVDLVSALTGNSSRASETIKRVLVNLAWHLAKLGSKGLLDRDIFQEEQLPDTWSDAEDKVNEFKDTLKEWADGLDRPLVVCVDELDRCRPDYALGLLETIRHLFDVSGVVVLLGVNAEELSHSISCLFGDHFDADRYIRRLIDRSIRLPVPKREDLSGFLELLLARTGLIERLPHERQATEAQRMLLTLVTPPGSLRDLQQAVTLVAMAIASMDASGSPNGGPRIATLIALAVLRFHNPTVYKRLMTEEQDVYSAAVSLRGSWPPTPEPGGMRGDAEMDAGRELVEARLLLTSPVKHERFEPWKIPDDFESRYMAAHGDETRLDRLSYLVNEMVSWHNMVAQRNLQGRPVAVSLAMPSLPALIERMEFFATEASPAE